MKTTATVLSVTGGIAIVEVVRASACEGCHRMADGKKGCAVCSLVGGTSRSTARAENRIGARPGDRVAIESASSRVLADAALVFLLPLLLSLAGWRIAALLSPLAHWQAVGAAIGFVCSFLGLWIYSRTVRSKRTDVVITEILTQDRPSGAEP